MRPSNGPNLSMFHLALGSKWLCTSGLNARQSLYCKCSLGDSGSNPELVYGRTGALPSELSKYVKTILALGVIVGLPLWTHCVTPVHMHISLFIGIPVGVAITRTIPPKCLELLKRHKKIFKNSLKPVKSARERNFRYCCCTIG